MIARPMCDIRRCRHLIGVRYAGNEGEASGEVVVCAAFPNFDNPIPPEILRGDDLHLEPHPKQDNEIVYERE